MRYEKGDKVVLKDRDSMFTKNTVEIDRVHYATLSYRSGESVTGYFTDDDIDHKATKIIAEGTTMGGRYELIYSVLDGLENKEAKAKIKDSIAATGEHNGWSEDKIWALQKGYTTGIEAAINVVRTAIELSLELERGEQE